MSPADNVEAHVRQTKRLVELESQRDALLAALREVRGAGQLYDGVAPTIAIPYATWKRCCAAIEAAEGGAKCKGT